MPGTLEISYVKRDQIGRYTDTVCPAYRLHRAAAAATVRRSSLRVSNVNIERLERPKPGPSPSAVRKYIPVFSALLTELSDLHL